MNTKMMTMSLLAVGAALSFSAHAGGRADLVRASLDAGQRYSSGELLVQFKDGTRAADRRAALSGIGAKSVRTLRAPRHGGELHLVRFGSMFAIDAAMRRLERSAAVDFVEPNWIYQHDAVSDDPYILDGSTWGMYGDASTPANEYGSGAAERWAAGDVCDKSVYVGVIDEGVMYDHEDLGNNVWLNPYDLVDGIDNDGNGYVDDRRGWDFAYDDRSVFDGPGDDHGTHVAGTIGAKGGNAVGVAGVCWSVNMISAKFLGRRGGSTSDAILAVDYLTDLKTRHGLNIVASNNSWGGGGFSQALLDAIERGGAADILFVASAGNSGVDIDLSPQYPAAYESDYVISVASIDSNGGLSSFSNYGLSAVDIAAPGGSVRSTVPSLNLRARTVESGYANYSGTSMASPHVTGALAMLASMYPGLTALQYRQMLLDDAVSTPGLVGRMVTGGRLDIGD